MTLPAYLTRLFDHQRWADERVLGALAAWPDASQRAIALFAHVLGAEQVWLARLEQRVPDVAVWPSLDLEGCRSLVAHNRTQYDMYLASLSADDLTRTVSYRNSAGVAFESRIEDILLHVAMHGSYHRGQVALLVRDGGAVPSPTDYIAYVRGAPAATRVAQ